MLGVLLAAACLAPTEGWPLERFDPDLCPQVYRVHGSADTEHALNIVVLPAGFTEDQLDDFRCGVDLMIERLMTFPPFDCYSESINVFRIDIASPESGVGVQHCKSGPCLPQGAADWRGKAEQCAGPLADPGEPQRAEGHHRGSCLELDLGVHFCPDETPYCKVLWPSKAGMRLLPVLAACAPDDDVTIVLANSGEWAGGGVDDTAHGLAVTTLCGVDAEFTRSRLLAHELGHALGLLDEYVDETMAASGDLRPDWHEGANVVQANPDGSVGSPPWAALCEDQAGVKGRCQMHCACSDCRSTVADPGPRIGLFEGGYYASCGYFTATGVCRMLNANTDEFCLGCQAYLRRFFERHLDMPPCAAPLGSPK